MKKYLFILMFAGLFGCTICDDRESPTETGTTFSKYFIWSYIEANDYTLEYAGHYGKGHIIGVHFEGEEVSLNNNQERYMEYANFYNDVSYNGNVLPYANISLVSSIVSVDIVCDRDFDAEHKAGESLADIVRLYVETPYEFIQYGYVYNGDYDHLKYGYRYVGIPLEEVCVDNSLLKLIHESASLRFSKLPLSKGEYNYTITIRIDDNEIVRNVVAVY